MALEPKNTKHSLNNALALAQASQLAYSDAATIQAGIAQIIGGKLDAFQFLDGGTTNTQGFLASFDDAIVLCFRGTQVIADWLQDAKIRLVPFRAGGLIHVGFRDALDSVYPTIDATLQQWSGKGRTLWITGHSLGAALGMLAGAYLRFPTDPTKTLPRPFAGLYTFGQPRVGTALYCRECDADFLSFYYRYVNNEDIVTRVPPRVLGYWHGGHVEYIDKDGVIHDDPSWWQAFLDQVEAGMDALHRLQAGQADFGAVQDHAIGRYIAAIQKNIDAMPAPAPIAAAPAPTQAAPAPIAAAAQKNA